MFFIGWPFFLLRTQYQSFGMLGFRVAFRRLPPLLNTSRETRLLLADFFLIQFDLHRV